MTTTAATLALSTGLRGAAAEAVRPRNVVVIITDDLGYADLGCYGGTLHRTPHLDGMARDGIRYTDFYATAPVCTPTRASLLTGRLPGRCGLPDVLWPHDTYGMDAQERTLPELLREAGYATALFGKWHLGHQPHHLPHRHGFDVWYGLPYPNDMDQRHPQNIQFNRNWGPIPLMEGDEVVEVPANDDLHTQRFTERTVGFIRANRARPFFVMLAHAMPHTRLGASPEFRGKSANGLFGDTVEEIDWSTGRILETLRELGLERDTLVIFTNDNGGALPPDFNDPVATERWMRLREPGERSHGSNGPLRGGKQHYFEGGVRVPCLVRLPGHAGVVESRPATMCDILPTALRHGGVALPADRVLDGAPEGLPAGSGDPERPIFLGGRRLLAVRRGRWKYIARTSLWNRADLQQNLLFDLQEDLGETRNLADTHPDIAAELRALLDAKSADVLAEAAARGYTQVTEGAG